MHIERDDKPAASFEKPAKPLGFKAYGSTPHLVGSRVGPGDYSLTAEQSALFLGERHRMADRHRKMDRIIVTEKIDGSCVSVARQDGKILALQRAGYLAATSPYALHHTFDRWVSARASLFMDLLDDDERLVGEWLHTAMGTRFEIADPDDLLAGFAMFGGRRRLPYDEFAQRTGRLGLRRAHLLSDGDGISIDRALELLGESGHHGALDGAEGAVWVMETNGEFNAIAKFVKADKVDGKYMGGITGGGDVVNYVGLPF
jgi:hypothetical protein|nr:RNA ligase family protein [Neorhizobium tomejilense]